jgi:hypothetical protein
MDYIEITTATGKNKYFVTREQDPIPKQEFQHLVSDEHTFMNSLMH